MLYIIGGAARSGKTLLSRKIVSEMGVPYFPLDALFRALAKGAPELGLAQYDTPMERPLKIWPITQHLFSYFLRDELKFLIEGDSILPSQVKELVSVPESIKCCFFGYSETTKEEKLAKVIRYRQGNTDWTKEIHNERMLEMIDRMIDFSKYLKEECFKYGIKYFDVSHDFNGPHEAAFKYLFEE